MPYHDAMTDDMINLGKRAVACKGWRWMPGMKTADAMRVIHDPDRWPDRPCAIREGGWIDTSPPRPLKDDLPDLCDPATLGCLLALVRAAWRCAVITSPDYDYDDEEARQGSNVIGWRAVETVRWTPVGEGATEADALIAALESAP